MSRLRQIIREEIQNMKLNEDMYSRVGGEQPYTDSELCANIVDSALGNSYKKLIQFKDTKYFDMRKKYPATVTDKWKVLYTSKSLQGTAMLSPNKRIIFAGIKDGPGIVGAFYFK